LSGSNDFIPDTDRLKEFIEPDLFVFLYCAFGEASAEYIVELIDGRDLCRGIVRTLSLWKVVDA
jgi:hypothetical protein